MKDVNKVKMGELTNSDYTFTLDSKQITSIVVGSLLLSLVLFFTGFFLGNKKLALNAIECETETKKNVAIFNISKKKKKDKIIMEDKNKKIVLKKDKKEETVLIKEESKEDKMALKDNKKEDKVDNKDKIALKDGKKEDKVDNKDKIALKDGKKEDKVVLDNKDKKENKVEDKIKDDKDKKDFKLPEIINMGSGDKDFKTSLKSSKKGKYVLQVKATREVGDAENLKEQLKVSGYLAFIEKVNSNGIIYNRVRIGFFKTKDIALKFKNNFEKESGFDKTFITKATK